MLKNLTRHGNSMALVIERPILELLNINVDTQFNITTDGTSLILTPVQDAKHVIATHSAIKRIGEKYCKCFEELAK